MNNVSDHYRGVAKMLVPSTSLRAKLLSVAEGLFFEEADFGAKIVLAPKLPSEIIKSLCLRANVYLSFRLLPVEDRFALHSTIAMEDDPEAMFYIQRTHDTSDIDLIRRLVAQDVIEIHPFDEINRNIASFRARVIESRFQIDDVLEMAATLVEVNDRQRQHLFDTMERLFATDACSLRQIKLVVEPIGSPMWIHTRPVADGPSHDPERFSRPYHILDQDQGIQLEINLARLLGYLFDPANIFPSPFGATSDTKHREFIDIVVFDPGYLFLFEAKAKEVTASSIERMTTRRVANIQKQIRKALRQLTGAYKRAARSGTLTLETPTRLVEVDVARTTVHLIVLVGENHSDLAKGTFPEEVVRVGERSDVAVHIMDLGMLSNHLRASKNVSSFAERLDRRWQASVQHRVIRFADE